MLSALRCDQICPDKLLSIFRQVHIFHSCIGNIYLILKIGGFLCDLRYEHSHLTKNLSIVHSQSNQNCEHDNDLHISTWSHLIAS